MAGMGAWLRRVRTCRPGYTFSSNSGGIGLQLRDGSFLPAHLVDETVLDPLLLSMRHLEQRLNRPTPADPFTSARHPGGGLGSGGQQ